MSILSTNTKLVKVGQEYSAGSGISIDEGVISVTGEFGKTYSAGDNIDIYEQGEQLYISSKDWEQDIANASANAYNEAVAQIPDPFDPSYLSAQIDNKLNSSDFTTWQEGQYNTDLQTIEGQINNKLDTSSFSDVSGSFLTAHQSLDGYATEDWVTAQGYITGVDLSPYYTTADANSLSSMLSGAIDYVSANADNVEVTNVVQSNSGVWNEVTNKLDATAFSNVSGSFYTNDNPSGFITGVDLSNYYTKDETSGKEELAQAFADIPVGDPEVNAYVTDNSATINGTTDLVQNSSGLWNDVAVYQSNSANYLTAHQDISYKLDESAFADVSGTFLTAHQSLDGYATVEDVESATSGKANTSDLLYYVPLSGIIDTTEHRFTKLGTYDLSFSSKDNNNVSSFGSYSNYSIDNYVRSANVPGYAAQLWLSNIGLYLYQSSAYGSANSGYVDLNRNGLNLKSVNGEAYFGINNYNLLNIYTCGNNTTPSFISFNRGRGPSYSSENTAIGQFFVTSYSDMYVPRYNPVWVVKNGSGDGFSIGASEAKGFDKDGNTIWSTKMSKATQLINGSNDPKPAILITPMPTTNTAQCTAAPYVSADYQSLSISYGPTASVPNIKIMPDGITTQILQGNSARAQFGINVNGVKFETSAGTWSLTGSVQKREIEYDADTSAITAIAGSAIGGGGVTGEFVPQSAFDELKQSYDALSSMLATYSGQWLLPNEGEE